MRGITIKGQIEMSAPDEFTLRAAKGIQTSRLPSNGYASSSSLDQRLENWSRVVRTSPNRDAACNWWADIYVKLRDSKNFGIHRRSVDEEREEELRRIPPDELDGWLVEQAWKMIPNPVHKWILQYYYVFRMGAGQIQTRLWQKHHVRLRGHQFDVALANARQAISHSLNQFQRR